MIAGVTSRGGNVPACNRNSISVRQPARAVLRYNVVGLPLAALFIDKKQLVCYYVIVMKLTQTIKAKYYTFQPGEFLPVYRDGQLANKREFHIYRIKWIIKHRHAALYQFTHYAG